MKHALANATLHPIDNRLPLTAETDASDFAIAATLNEEGCQVALHSQTFSATEQKHSVMEKQAYAVVKHFKKWRHALIGGHFLLVTD